MEPLVYLTRSEFARQVEEQVRQLRSMRGGDPDRLAFHLEGFARTARLTTPSIAVEVIKRRRTS